MGKFCAKCGSELNVGAKFCPKCGAPTSITEEGGKVLKNKEQVPPKKTRKKKSSEGRKDNLEKDFNSQNPSKKMGCWTYSFIALIFFGFIGFLQDKCEGEDSNVTDVPTQHDTEQTLKEKTKSSESNKQEEVRHDFFESGYEYSASYRVNRKQGYGLSANYKYKIKIYNDGTTEIVEEIRGDEFGGHPSELYSCKIEKKSESYRDVAATWYEVEFKNGRLHVDNNGNIILLNVNGNDKTIQEAITSGDCRFGQFSKSKLEGTKVYRCKTCGKEYNPEKEAIVSEEYCYADYPQECKRCGKSYTINTEPKGGYGACKGTCASCFEKYENRKIYERVTGRTY